MKNRVQNKKRASQSKPVLDDNDPEVIMIKALLKIPMKKRMNWYRQRLPNGGSCI
jgi:hypothetical protein